MHHIDVLEQLLTSEEISRAERIRIFLCTLVFLLVLYLGAGTLTQDFAEKLTLETWVDSLIPLSPAWIIIYIYMYFQTLSPFFVLKTRRSFARLLCGAGILYLVALPIWVLMPVVRPNSDIIVSDVWSYWLAVVYQVDPSTNCFPSMHVALSFYAAWYIFELDRLVGWILLFGALLIWYSTLALKQHWFVDGAVAILLVLIVESLMKRAIPWKEEEKLAQPRINHLYWLSSVIVGEGIFIVSYFLTTS